MSYSHTRWAACCAVLAGFLAMCSPAFANDGAFGGSGGSLVPAKNEHVAMRAENITMEVVKSTATDKRQAPLEWKVDAVYTFENTSKKEVTVQVGFPEFSCGGDSPCPEDHPYSFRGLKTGMRGKPITHHSYAPGLLSASDLRYVRLAKTQQARRRGVARARKK